MTDTIGQKRKRRVNNELLDITQIYDQLPSKRPKNETTDLKATADVI